MVSISPAILFFLGVWGYRYLQHKQWEKRTVIVWTAIREQHVHNIYGLRIVYDKLCGGSHGTLKLEDVRASIKAKVEAGTFLATKDGAQAANTGKGDTHANNANAKRPRGGSVNWGANGSGRDTIYDDKITDHIDDMAKQLDSGSDGLIDFNEFLGLLRVSSTLLADKLVTDKMGETEKTMLAVVTGDTFSESELWQGFLKLDVDHTEFLGKTNLAAAIFGSGHIGGIDIAHIQAQHGVDFDDPMLMDRLLRVADMHGDPSCLARQPPQFTLPALEFLLERGSDARGT